MLKFILKSKLITVLKNIVKSDAQTITINNMLVYILINLMVDFTDVNVIIYCFETPTSSIFWASSISSTLKPISSTSFDKTEPSMISLTKTDKNDYKYYNGNSWLGHRSLYKKLVLPLCTNPRIWGPWDQTRGPDLHSVRVYTLQERENFPEQKTCLKIYKSSKHKEYKPSSGSSSTCSFSSLADLFSINFAIPITSAAFLADSFAAGFTGTFPNNFSISALVSLIRFSDVNSYYLNTSIILIIIKTRY